MISQKNELFLKKANEFSKKANLYVSARIDSEIIFFSHNCPYRNHMQCVYMCNTQTYYSSTKCLSLTHTCHTSHKGGPIVPMGVAPSAPPPLVVSFSLCAWCGTCVLGSGTLYLNNMSVYCTYIQNIQIHAWPILAEKYSFRVKFG